jgi:hypothetical protein
MNTAVPDESSLMATMRQWRMTPAGSRERAKRSSPRAAVLGGTIVCDGASGAQHRRALTFASGARLRDPQLASVSRSLRDRPRRAGGPLSEPSAFGSVEGARRICTRHHTGVGARRSRWQLSGALFRSGAAGLGASDQLLRFHFAHSA